MGRVMERICVRKVVSLCIVSVFLLSAMFQALDYGFVTDEETSNGLVSSSTQATQETSPFIINLTSPTNYVIYTENALNDSSTTMDITFTKNESKTLFVQLPKNSRVINAKLNLSGHIKPFMTDKIINSGFEKDIGWVFDSNHTELGVEYTSDWQTQGSRSVRFYWTGSWVPRGYHWASISQEVDLTHIERIYFDYHGLTGYTLDWVHLRFLVDDNELWNVPGGQSARDTFVDVSSPIYYGIHNITWKFDVTCGAGGGCQAEPPRGYYIDNIRVRLKRVIYDSWNEEPVAPHAEEYTTNFIGRCESGRYLSMRYAGLDPPRSGWVDEIALKIGSITGSPQSWIWNYTISMCEWTWIPGIGDTCVEGTRVDIKRNWNPAIDLPSTGWHNIAIDTPFFINQSKTYIIDFSFVSACAAPGNMWNIRFDNSDVQAELDRWTCDGVYTETGAVTYLILASYENSTRNPYLDVGGDGDKEWEYLGAFKDIEIRTSDFSKEINEFLLTATPNERGLVDVPLLFHSDSAGTLSISNINITYEYDISYLYDVSYVPPETGYNINSTANRASVNVSYSGFYVDDDATAATVDGTDYPIKIYNGHKYVEYNETISQGSYWSNHTVWWDTLESPLKVIEVTPCDQHGNPKQNFTRGSLAYFKVTVNNTFSESIGVLITVNAYDADDATIGAPSIQGTISPGRFTYILGLPISSSAQLGNAIVYANAFTDWPHLGGVSYCSEKSATFQIVEM